MLVAVLAAWPALSQPGLLNTRGGGDSPFLLQRLHQLTAALAGGHFPARWMPDAAYGDGYPFFNFYAPLSLYIAAAFRALGFSFVRAIHLAQLAGFLVAGLGAYALGRRWLGSPWAGLLVAVAYTAAPFHMVNVYVRGDSLAEFWAMAFYPLVLLTADALVSGQWPPATRDTPPATRPSPLATRLALFALAYAALIVGHNISALIFSPFVLLTLAIGWARARRAAQARPLSPAPPPPRSPVPVPAIAAALLLAFALAAWFFVPALAERDLAQLGPVTAGYFHYANHFRGLDLLQRTALFDYNPDGGVAFRLGLVQVVAALAGAGVLFWRGRRGLALALLAALLLATLMITPLSRPLWDHLPLLAYTQFPWRFLSVAALFAALLTGGLATLPERAAAPALTGLAGLALLLAALLGLRTDHLILTDADVTAERLAQYEWFTGNIGTTVSAEYLPPAAVPRPWTSAWLNDGRRDRATATAGALTAATLRTRRATRQVWDVAAGPGGATVLLPTLAWPGWRATLDGQPIDLSAAPGSGLIALAVPEGGHVVELALGRTPIRAAAEWLSLAALLVAGGLLLLGWRGARPAAGTLVALLAAAAGLLLLAWLWRGDPRALPPGDLTWDFAQMAYLHHDRGGVAFEDGARLYAYGYSGEEVPAGGTLVVTLSVAPGQGRAATLALATPATARPPAEGAAGPPLLAAATQPLAGDSVVFRLSIPPDAPPGLYAPRLTLDGARPLLPSGATRGDLFLRPVRVLPGASAGPRPSGDLDVRATALTLRDATTLDGRFAWYTARPLGARYQFSWRLQDAAGATLAQLDAQPGYGFQPSTLWPAGQWTADWLALRLPDAAPAAGDYPLVMRLYDVGSGQTVLTRRVGLATWDGAAWSARLHEPEFAVPDDRQFITATFSDAGDPLIALPGYRLVREGDALRLTLYWQAAVDAPGEFTRFVHLLDGAGAIVAQSDGAPAGDSLPTGQWVAGEVVADAVTFDLSGRPPGNYRLAVGFYAPTAGLPRLNAADDSGPLPDGRVLLPETVVIEE